MSPIKDALSHSKPARRWLNCELLEDRVTPSRPLPLPMIFVGAETGAPPVVKAYDAETGKLQIIIANNEPGFINGEHEIDNKYILAFGGSASSNKIIFSNIVTQYIDLTKKESVER